MRLFEIVLFVQMLPTPKSIRTIAIWAIGCGDESSPDVPIGCST
jgi:hypothetical protein